MSVANPMSAIRAEGRAVSLVIPTRNGGARFRGLLEVLGRQDVEFELLVLDTASSDGTPEAAEEAGARVGRVAPGEFQHGRTRNRGVSETAGGVVLFLTQDAVPTGDDYVRTLAAALDDETVDGAWARQVPRSDVDPLLADRLAGWSGAATEARRSALVAGDARASRGKFESLTPMERYLACAFDNVAACIRRSVWERHAIPERSFGEDIAWARDVLLAGGTLAFEPRACVEHSHRIGLASEFRRIRADHENLNELFGLRTVPTWADVFRGWKGQRLYYRELLSRSDLRGLERMYWRAYSVPYAFLETAAQFLGARAG